jgi:hypothetical protein
MGRTGKIYTARQDKIETSVSGAVHDRDDVRVEQNEMVNARMLASAEPGEGLYIFGGHVYPFKVMYLDFPQVETAKLNYFAQVLDPTQEEVDDAKRQCLLQSNEYVQQANDFVDNNMELLESKEMASSLSRIKALEITDNISKQVMLSIGLSILDLEDADSIDNESSLPPDSETMVSGGDDDSYIQDAELQIMEAQDAYLDEYDEDTPVDYSDYEAYAESWDQDDQMEFPTGLENIDVDAEQGEMDLSVFEDSPFDDLEGQYKQRYVSSNLSASELQSAIDNGQAEIGESLTELLQAQGKDEADAINSAQSAVKRINQVLSYPNTQVTSHPLSLTEVDDVVAKTLQSLGSRF